MRIKTVFLSHLFLPLLFTFAWPLTTQAQTAESLFQQGIAAFQKGEIETARIAFQETLKLSGDNPIALYNLALIEQRLGKPGVALALWRKALALDPSYTAARQAIDWTREKLERQEIPHEVSLWESFRNLVLVRLQLEMALIFSATLLLTTGWLFLAHFGKRKRAILDERPAPGFPTLASLAGLGLFLSFFLSGAKALDMNQLRGTIVDKKVAALSSPSGDGTELFDLYEGLEVIVRQTKDEWVQVTYPGATTGWIPRKSLITTLDQAVLP